MSLPNMLPAVVCAIHPYIDMGTGSLVIQVLIASFVGGLFMLKMYWRKVKVFFKSIRSRGNKD